MFLLSVPLRSGNAVLYSVFGPDIGSEKENGTVIFPMQSAGDRIVGTAVCTEWRQERLRHWPLRLRCVFPSAEEFECAGIKEGCVIHLRIYIDNLRLQILIPNLHNKPAGEPNYWRS